MSLWIGLIGVVVGIISNYDRKLFGNLVFNFIVTTLIFAYDRLAESTGIWRIPEVVMIFFVGYVVGTYGQKAWPYFWRFFCAFARMIGVPI